MTCDLAHWKEDDPLRAGERLTLGLKEPSKRTVLALRDKKVATGGCLGNDRGVWWNKRLKKLQDQITSSLEGQSVEDSCKF